MKNVNSVNKAILKARSELTSMPLKDIIRPTSIEEGRANLKRFYGCVDGDLLVLLDSKDKYGSTIKFNEGSRKNGEWDSFNENARSPIPHSAINNLIVIGEYAFADVNIDKMQSLSDLYKITESGGLRGREDPSFTMNLILGGENPITEYDNHYTIKSLTLFEEIGGRFNLKYNLADWVKDSSAFDIYDNNDIKVKKAGGFYNYSRNKGFNWRWKQINNLETRYLHWLLLGPFAPYRFSDSDVIASAA